MFQATDPTTGRIRESFTPHDANEVQRRLSRAADEFADWRNTPIRARCERLQAVADALERDAGNLATLITHEMGKPIAQSRAEIEKCAWVCRYYAKHAPALLATEPRDTGDHTSHVRYDPIGPVLAIMPWNFPFWQVFRFTAPALAAGNVALLKHARNVPGCAQAIERLHLEAGMPEGAMQTLLVGHDEIEPIIADTRVRALTLTGSTGAGSTVAAIAGKYLKKTVLELGGSDPFIVLDDADVNAAAETAVTARMINNGQSCIAAKRFIVDSRVIGAFRRRFVERVRALRVGDPSDESTDVGPLARADLVETLHDQVRRTLDAGGKLLCGGEPMGDVGSFYAPTVIETGRDLPIAQEETFGPVAALISADGESDAIAIANGTPFGLGASLWTRDLERAERLVPEIDAGCVFVNSLVQSDPRVPFGGIKASGYGRELSREGIREFVNVKTVRTVEA